MKKIISIFTVIIILFIIFLVVYISPRNYQVEYQLNNFKVVEKYDKEKKYYKFIFKYKQNSFEMISFDTYDKSRKHIESIDVFEEDNYFCIIPNSKKISTYPLCKMDNENVSYHLIENLKSQIDGKYYKNLEDVDKKYENIKIHSLNDKKFLIWNYSGLVVIDKNNNKTINMFDEDVYDTSLAYVLNDYFIIPFYENEFRFNAFNLYNIKTGDLTKWKLSKNIYFDSYILGKDNNSLFLFDRKDKKEYELVPHKQKLRTISPKVLENGKWENSNKQSLANKNVLFTNDEIITYKIIENKLYKVFEGYKERISNHVVKEIVSYNNDEVYYIVNDSLYLYNISYGEVKLLTNFEWNFNFKNKIFVY